MLQNVSLQFPIKKLKIINIFKYHKIIIYKYYIVYFIFKYLYINTSLSGDVEI